MSLGDTFQSVFYCMSCFIFCYIAWMYTRIFAKVSSDNCQLRRPISFTLDDEDFDCLVRGGALKVALMQEGKVHCITLALQDIGFDVMTQSVVRAKMGKGTYQDHCKIIN